MVATAPFLSPVSTTLLLVRHAETTDNATLRLSGWTDSDLSERGEEQVRLLAEHIERAHSNVRALYTSPLVRAQRTADRIGKLIGLRPVPLENLREIYFGELDGLPLEEIEQRYASVLQANEDAGSGDFAWPDGESRSGFDRRVRSAMNHVAQAHPGQPVAVVTHGGVIATFLTALHHESPARWRKWVVPNASISEIRWDPLTQMGAMVRHGDAIHLQELTREETES